MPENFQEFLEILVQNVNIARKLSYPLVENLSEAAKALFLVAR